MFIEFILIFILSLFLINIVKSYGQHINLIDIPNNRSTHKEHTPSGAGIGFFLAVFIVLLIFHFNYLLSYFWIFLAIFIVFVMGVVDDRYNTSLNTKFIVLAISTVVLSFDCATINDVGIFFGTHVVFGWASLFFTIFAIVGFTNALNLIDGLDGLAATLSLVILGTFFAVGFQHDDFFIMLLSMGFFSTLLAFLVFNWNPASIFMGDSGSLTLGFVISILSLKSLAYLPAISILFITAVPLFDTIIAMARRKRNGSSIFSADRCHFHHILRHYFEESTKKTVLFMGMLQVVFSFTGLILNKNIDQGYLLILFILSTIVLYMILGIMIKRGQYKC